LIKKDNLTANQLIDKLTFSIVSARKQELKFVNTC